jgi:hypothetical protein
VATSLKDILPVKRYKPKPQAGEFPVSLTDVGRAHPAFAGDVQLWDIIPPVLSVFPGVVPSQAARILVTAQTPEGSEAIILSQRYGQGKVVAVFTDSLWKWQLHPRANETRPYQRFWDQMISWLLPEEDEVDKDKLAVFTDQDTVVLGEALRISARLGKADRGATAQVRCSVVMPGGEEAPFAMRAEPVTTASGETYPGFVTSYTATVPGLYTVIASAMIGGRKKVSEPLSFYVKPFSAESIPRPANVRVLRRIAESSGGRFFQDADALNDALASLNFSTIEEESSEHRTLWQTWFVIACLTLLASISWLVRKMNNMP